MGKKHKKLKKKAQKPAVNYSSAVPVQTSSTPSQSSATIAASSVPVEKTAAVAEQSHEYDHVRRDIRNILITMLIIVLILLGLFFLDQKTGYLANLGSWFYKVLRIQTQ